MSQNTLFSYLGMLSHFIILTFLPFLQNYTETNYVTVLKDNRKKRESVGKNENICESIYGCKKCSIKNYKKVHNNG